MAIPRPQGFIKNARFFLKISSIYYKDRNHHEDSSQLSNSIPIKMAIIKLGKGLVITPRDVR